MICITSKKIRSVLKDCMTVYDIISVLRLHKIKYSFSTDTGSLAVKIPYRKGYIRIYPDYPESAPLAMHNIRYPERLRIPVLHPED